MDVLIEQERALHSYHTRQNPDIVARMLHPSFKEVGRSGNRFDYGETLVSLKGETNLAGLIHSQDYECIELEPYTQLLLYKSAWVDESGAISAFTQRSSILVFTGQNWQVQYHQGTPCESFELV
ncbi:MAG: DUF4440 domain-containing protein [Marinomonas sp.]